jgi:hypothetical protein
MWHSGDNWRARRCRHPENVDNPNGAHWADDGMIVLALRRGIVRVPATGGTPEVIVPAAENERMAQPQLLPGGGAVLFTLADVSATGDPDWDQGRIVVHALGSGARTVVFENARDARYLPTGHLAYVVEDDLFAVRFDLQALATTGPAVPLIYDLATGRRTRSSTSRGTGSRS